MHRTLLLGLSCLAAFSVNARQVITGTATDKETQQPVEGAQVNLLQLPDSVQVEATQTSSDGLFMFYKADSAKTYCLKFQHALYKPLSLSVAPKKGSMINSVGAVALEPHQYNLKEIVVNGNKMMVTELGDRTVYSIPEGMQKTSTDGVDVLRKVPSVQVDYLNEDITVNGKSNIKIEVDGISRDKGYLKRLHPSQISKMEVITNPSGKYDADVDAVINVVTNPAMRYGLKGMYYAGAFPIAKNGYVGMGNASLDYGLEKISYYVAANGALQKIGINSDMHRESGSNTINQNASQMINAGMSSVNMGFIYDPDEHNDINFNVAYNNTGYKLDGSTWNRTESDGLSSLLKTTSNTRNTSGGLTTSLFYKHAFDKKTQHGLEAEINYYNSLGNQTKSNFQNTYYNPADSTTELYHIPWQQERSNSTVRNLYGQSNYTLPFDSVYFFNVGISANYNRYITDNTSLSTSISDLDYTDLRLGGYAEISRNFSKGSLRVGTRFENSRVDFTSSNPHYYRSILPYVNGLYKFNGDNSLKLAYSRRVIRPTSTQLNPMVSALDSQTISKGNIDLKPAYRDNFQLTYDWKLPIKKVSFNISPQLYYEYQTELIQTIISQNSVTKKFESMPTNIANGYEYGGALSVNSQIGQILFNSNFRYSFYHVDKYLDQIDAMTRHGWNWNSFVMSPLPHNFQFMTMLYMTGPVLNGQTETKTSSIFLLGLGKQFKNNSVLRLIAYNPLTSNFYKSTTTINTGSLYQVQHNYMKKDYGFLLMYVYSFKVGKSIERQKRTVEQQSQDNMIKLPMTY